MQEQKEQDVFDIINNVETLGNEHFTNRFEDEEKEYLTDEDKEFAENAGKFEDNPKSNLSSLITGKLLIKLIEPIICFIIVQGIALILKKQINKSDLKTTADEKKELGVFIDEYLKSINLSFQDPLTNLIIGISFIYGGKVMEAVEHAPKIEKRTKEDGNAGIRVETRGRKKKIQ
jgi:hypothetical protein